MFLGSPRELGRFACHQTSFVGNSPNFVLHGCRGRDQVATPVDPRGHCSFGSAVSHDHQGKLGITAALGWHSFSEREPNSVNRDCAVSTRVSVISAYRSASIELSEDPKGGLGEDTVRASNTSSFRKFALCPTSPCWDMDSRLVCICVDRRSPGEDPRMHGLSRQG